MNPPGGVPEAPHQGVRFPLAGELRQLRGEALAHQDRDPHPGRCSTYPRPKTLPPPFGKKVVHGPVKAQPGVAKWGGLQKQHGEGVTPDLEARITQWSPERQHSQRTRVEG